jgi:hypothetical protein
LGNGKCQNQKPFQPVSHIAFHVFLLI